MKARIEGEGVGAIRYCSFSTGDFVEPITAWEKPHRLAFDVVKNPPVSAVSYRTSSRASGSREQGRKEEGASLLRRFTRKGTKLTVLLLLFDVSFIVTPLSETEISTQFYDSRCILIGTV